MPVNDFLLDVPVDSTRYTRRTRNGRVVDEHALRGQYEDVGEGGLERSPMSVDEALAFFNRILLLGVSGAGKSFALEKLYHTLKEASDNNDQARIRKAYPDWQHAPLPMPLKIDAPEFCEWLRSPSQASPHPAEMRLFRYVADGLSTDFAALSAQCHRESFVLIVEEWGALNEDDAALVDEEIKSAEEIISTHRPAIVYSAALDSALCVPRLGDGEVERITIAKLSAAHQNEFVQKFCAKYGAAASDFQSILNTRERLADTPRGLWTLLEEWKRRNFPPDLDGVSELADLYELQISQALPADIAKQGLDALLPVADALLEQYKATPSVRLLRFTSNPQTDPLIPALTESGFLRKHQDDLYSVREAVLQDYLVGRRLWQRYANAGLIRPLREVLGKDKPRREPINLALLWSWGVRQTGQDRGNPAPPTQEADFRIGQVLGAIKVLTAHPSDCATGILADFISEVGPSLDRKIEVVPPTLGDIRPRLRALLEKRPDSSVDRYIIGRALAYCIDPRAGTDLISILDLPQVEFLPIPAGEAILGQTNRDREFYGPARVPPNNEPIRNLSIPQFWLAKYPITNRQFAAFKRDRFQGYDSTCPWEGLVKPESTQWRPQPGCDNHPVASVSWDEAMGFCRWYSRMMARRVELVDSLRWEYAARGARDDRVFPWGNQRRTGAANSQEEGLPGVAAVGAFSDGTDLPFGVSDMCGNVFEWCQDSHDDGEPDYKVTKGGSYNHELLRCRNATRGKKHRSSQHPYLGFRVASSEKGPDHVPRIILAGGGFAGTATAIRLLAMADRPLQVVIVESHKERTFGGLAYSTQTAYWEHLFNLQAGRISLYREDRDDFVNWLNSGPPGKENWHEAFKNIEQFDRSSAVPRRLYQEYLTDRMMHAVSGAHPDVGFRLVDGEVVDVTDGESHSVRIRPADGGADVSLECDQLILCTGNVQTKRPRFLENVVGKPFLIEDQYSEKAREIFKSLPVGKRILVLGSALRGCDVVMSLRSPLSDLRREGVTVTLLSRHGRLHKPYDPGHVHDVIELPKPDFLDTGGKMSKDDFVGEVQRAFIGAARSGALAHLPEHLRSERILKAWEAFVPDALKKLHNTDVKELLEEHKSLITVLRIGVVPEIADTVKQAVDEKLCFIWRAEVKELARTPDGAFKVTLNEDGSVRHEKFDVIVNCMGREQDYNNIRVRNELWGNLFRGKLTRPHAKTGIGIDVDPHGMLIDSQEKPSRWIGSVGVMREGVEFERFGRLGSFSFTLGPLKNQALEAAVHVLRRLDGKNSPSGKLSKKRPARDGSGVEQLMQVCVEEASQMAGVDSGVDLRMPDPHFAWKLALDHLKARTHSARQEVHNVMRTYATGVLSDLEEAGVSEEKRQRFIDCLWRCLEDVALSHLTRIDEVQPGEMRLTESSRPDVGGNGTNGGYPERRVKVFVTYYWDSTEHKSWVRKLVEKLRADALDVTWDQEYGPQGEDQARQLEAVIRSHDRVLVICSGGYKEKADARDMGQKYMGTVISQDVVRSCGISKFIPVIRTGPEQACVPSILSNVPVVHLGDDPIPEQVYQGLVWRLHQAVFISYSWDSKEHKLWVKELATELRKSGVYVVLDGWHNKMGDRVGQFMETAIRESQWVLVICTENYKVKFDNRAGGVGYEGCVISGEMIRQYGRTKFIPVFCPGSGRNCLPSALQEARTADLGGDRNSKEEYEELVRRLLGSDDPPPAVGIPSGRRKDKS